MLLLRAPSRRPRDMAISLRAPAGCATAADAMRELAIGSSCPPDVADRVRLCIFHSGRYDCRVSAAAAFFLKQSPELTAWFGGAVILVDDA